MAEYSPKKIAHIGPEHDETFILWQIGPIWGIEQPYIDDPSEWRYYDEEGAKEAWDKLKSVKRSG